jgi:hypothetical protein
MVNVTYDASGTLVAYVDGEPVVCQLSFYSAFSNDVLHCTRMLTSETQTTRSVLEDHIELVFQTSVTEPVSLLAL